MSERETRADLIAAVRTVKPYLSERECLAIVRGVLGVVRIESPTGIEAAFTAMIDALLGEVGE